MIVRKPQFDFSRVHPHWTPHIEFAQARNATSVVPAHIEPYLIKVLRRAMPLLQKSNPKLAEEVKLFIRQESVHMNLHHQYNKVLYDHGYDGVAEFERELSEDCQRLLDTESLKFHLAYADGFESMGAVAGQVWHNGSLDELLEGGNPTVIDLWKWHMAEEFEHRNVCYQVYMELYGKKSFFNRYFYRIYGFMYAVRHLGSFQKRLGRYLIEKDRASMTPAEVEQSRKRERRSSRIYAKAMLPRLLLVFSPFYDPAKKKTPPGLYEYLDRFPLAPGNPQTSTT